MLFQKQWRFVVPVIDIIALLFRQIIYISFLHLSLFWISYNLGYYVRRLLLDFAVYNQQDATFHYLVISVRRSTCFRRFFRP